MRCGCCRAFSTTSRPGAPTTPQHVQNLVIRDYAQRHGLLYKLSAVECAMPGCYMVLETVLAELGGLEGIICYSMFMLPARPGRRAAIYRRLSEAEVSLHGALEGLAVRTEGDFARLEDLFLVERFAARGPLSLAW
ncbi:MAG: sporadic carbohydrate cluster protein, TIGR04323 family [Alphaproteobacteria bacterium]|nr:sporadic carbohydrate cluster protein, TIGR04323 family [Alphaproteobacteria bacterium]